MKTNRSRLFALIALSFIIGAGFAVARRNSITIEQAKAPVPSTKVTAALGTAPLRALQATPQVTLYSISPHALSASPAAAGKEKFGSWVVLGKTAVSGTQKNVLLQAFYEGISRSGGTMLCFEPRHALRVQNNGKSYDFVICFACRQFTSPTQKYNQAINPEAQTVFDAILKNAGVPLAG
ncbi:MAG TPA: hypothetical protein VGB77_04245 [Abditibacteriaceae bacterium]|jgi:hypothetical protein